MAGAALEFSRFNLRTDLPVHRQVAAYLKAIISLGQISSGDAVPSPAELSVKLGTRPVEVRRAYSELVERGFLTADGPRWRVSDDHAATAGPDKAEELCARLWDLVAEARQAGITKAELARMFEQLLARP